MFSAVTAVGTDILVVDGRLSVEIPRSTLIKCLTGLQETEYMWPVVVARPAGQRIRARGYVTSKRLQHGR